MLNRVRFSVVLSVLLIIIAPITGLAAEPDAGDTVLEETASVIVTELQTGAATASEEFIELYNQSDEAVDITGWQIRYINSTTTDGGTTLLATIGTADQPVVLASKGYFLLHTSSVALPAGVSGQTFSAGLSKTDKTVALFSRDEQTCRMSPIDAVAWEAVPGTTKGEGAAVAVPSSSSSKDKLLIRWRNTLGEYTDMNNNFSDFSLGTTFADATAGSDNPAQQVDAELAAGSLTTITSLDAPDCQIPEPSTSVPDAPDESPPSVSDPVTEEEERGPNIPTGNNGLKSPQLSEILPNPASPQTDAEDEFVELYNPNDAVFDLSGYILESGLTTKHRYTFPAGKLIQPKTFMAFFSADTRLSLSNAGSQIRLLDPFGRLLVESEKYGSAQDGQSWLLANGKWQWTTKPTPNSVNVVSTPAVKGVRTTSVKKASSTKSGASASSNRSSTAQNEAIQTAASSMTKSPLHPGILATVGVSALIYGVYEYRHDLYSKLYQFRTNRAARRAARQKS